MTETGSVVHKALEDLASRRRVSADDEKHWVSFTDLPSPLPSRAEGLLVFAPSGEKRLLIGWQGRPCMEIMGTLEGKSPTLAGELTTGKRLVVQAGICYSARFQMGGSGVQLCALTAGKVILGNSSPAACEARFRLINFHLDTSKKPRKKHAGWRQYPPSVLFRAGAIKVSIRTPLRSNEPRLVYEQGSELRLVALHPVLVQDLVTSGWRLIRLLALASRRDVGYQDATFGDGQDTWAIGYDRGFLPIRDSQSEDRGFICSPLTRKYLPRLLKTGLLCIDAANKRYGMLNVLAHYIQAQNTDRVQSVMTSLFQGYEACAATYRSMKCPKAVAQEHWDQALTFLDQPDAPLRVRRALLRMRRQVRNEPTTKETLNMILRELRLKSDLSFWRQRQGMFHRGDIDRERPLESHVVDMYEADDLLGRMLLRMVGYSGKIWCHNKEYAEIGHVP